MKNILVPIDFSDASKDALAVASTWSAPWKAKLWLVHVTAPDPDFVGFRTGPTYVREHRADVLRQEHADLQHMAQELKDQGLDAEALLIQGPTTETLLAEIDKLDIDLVVMGSHGRGGLYKAFVGSVSEQVLHMSEVPVLIVPDKNKHR
jgi:nucleotide-binding universal stress UspA family protein